jgi:hypothetical protein
MMEIEVFMTNIPSMRRLLFVALFFRAFCAYAQQKYALVIGNAAYTAVPPLRNTTNDADDMRTELVNLGFTVELLRNADLPTMINAVARRPSGQRPPVSPRRLRVLLLLSTLPAPEPPPRMEVFYHG